MRFTSRKQFAFVLGLVAVTSYCAAQESKYLGVWNYDQPNGETSENIAQLQCPAPKGSPEGMHGFGMMIPQIGNLTITNAADGHLKGVTDQGCSWTFKVGSSSAELEPASQTCFNKLIGSSYTITRWSIRVDGNQESETLMAKSHHQMGDCDFAMQTGKRTKAEDTDSSGLFVGDWRYDTLDPKTRMNVAQKICGEESSKPAVVPISGTVTISKVSDGGATGGHFRWMFMEAESAGKYRYPRLATELRKGWEGVEAELLDNRQRWAASAFQHEQRAANRGRELHDFPGNWKSYQSILKVVDHDESGSNE